MAGGSIPSKTFSRKLGSLTLEIIEGDISRVPADAVANAANNAFWMGGGVAGALKRAGGDIIEKEAMAQGPRSVGEVVATGAGSLPARYVIHAAVMGQDLRTSAEYIEAATRNTLREAEKLRVVSIALPAFGTGVGGFPPEECARIMGNAVLQFVSSARSVKRVVFVLYGRASRESFEKILARLAG